MNAPQMQSPDLPEVGGPGSVELAPEIEFAKLDVIGRINEIADGLLKQDPMLPVHLENIHKQLLQYEELVHLLTPEQIGQLMSGQKRHAAVQLVKEVVAKKSTRIPKTTADDL